MRAKDAIDAALAGTGLALTWAGLMLMAYGFLIRWGT